MATMHYSAPRSERLLNYLRAQGGSATGWQIREALRSDCPSTDVSALRQYAHVELRIAAHVNPVKQVYIGLSENGCKVHRYMLCDALMQACVAIGPDGQGRMF